MNTAPAACASSKMNVNWHQINWNQVNRQIRKLQIRIVKAIQENRYGKAKALQWLLTHSFSGKALAVRRVTENQGKRTAGVDGKIWSTPQSKAKAIISLKRHGYQPKPLRRVYIPKTNGTREKRPLDIPTMKDRAMQALHKLALEPIAETTADGNSYGFRPARSTRDAIAHSFILLGKKGSAQWILEGDIKGCFD
ncbi:MAG: reverse transcriptase N-terminal domain-containing protein, partial [Bacteroidota bacterium]